ncbi:MAG: glycosyltransferase family 39 protein [Candidatus Aureabacteria bacterium]|nr:glycosyltransferase family 39 protein [Candidatus Auribacterota bacterium]
MTQGTSITEKNDRFSLLLLISLSLFVFFGMLGTRELWTHEGRWAVICLEMMQKQDFFHPTFLGFPYYDKPLGSYWLILLFTKLFQGLNEWALRFPSALSGLFTVISVYILGRRLFNPKTGLLAGFLLVSSYFFVLWGRTAGSDMLNVAGTVMAITWYHEKKERPSFFNYLGFFSILSITSLMKGLLGAVIPLLILFPELLREGNWKRHITKPSCYSAIITAGLIYILPFLLSTWIPGNTSGKEGLKMVFIENIVRFIKPFDHTDPFYTYLIYFPLYFFPWILLFIPALIHHLHHWKTNSPASRWIFLANVLIFLFFTASGSRRSYYILPLLPFASLLVSSWIMQITADHPRLPFLVKNTSLFLGIILLIWFNLIQPFMEKTGGLKKFMNHLRTESEKIKPWNEWQAVTIFAIPKTVFYLKNSNRVFDLKDDPESEGVEKRISAFILKHQGSIIVSKKKYEEKIKKLYPFPFVMIEEEAGGLSYFSKAGAENKTIAFIPEST